jgi:hypothetical protein
VERTQVGLDRLFDTGSLSLGIAEVQLKCFCIEWQGSSDVVLRSKLETPGESVAEMSSDAERGFAVE